MTMSNRSDPEAHRHMELAVLQRAEELLADDRLRIDTTVGTRVAKSLQHTINKSDGAVDIKRQMVEMDNTDRALQNSMPVGASLEVVFHQKKWFVLNKTVARLRVVCVSPTRDLLAGRPIQPMGTQQVQKILGEVADSSKGIPTTLVLVSTSGFSVETHELVDRRAGGMLILLEPNDVGGWVATGPVEMKSISDLFDPESDSDKRRRIRAAVEDAKPEMLAGGLVADKLSSRTQISLPLIEEELKSYARQNGLVAKRLEGRMVLYQEGTLPEMVAAAPGGSPMAMLDKIKSLFSRKGENEKKVAYLSERKAALSVQRDRLYDDLTTMEKQEDQLRRQFRESNAAITKKRVTSQLLQLRKDYERRQQMVSVLNQQVNVVSTHLHNLQLVQQGTTADLPDSDEIAADAVKAEEMLAQLESDAEVAETVASSPMAKMNSEEQALFDELEQEAAEARGKGAEPAKPASSGKSSTSAPGVAAEDEIVPPTSGRDRSSTGEAEAG